MILSENSKSFLLRLFEQFNYRPIGDLIHSLKMITGLRDICYPDTTPVDLKITHLDSGVKVHVPLDKNEMSRIFGNASGSLGHLPLTIDFTFTEDTNSAEVPVIVSVNDKLLGEYSHEKFKEYCKLITGIILENGKYAVVDRRLVLTRTGLKREITQLVDRWVIDRIVSSTEVVDFTRVPNHELCKYLRDRLCLEHRSTQPTEPGTFQIKFFDDGTELKESFLLFKYRFTRTEHDLMTIVDIITADASSETIMNVSSLIVGLIQLNILEKETNGAINFP